jgi:hypothetical protein
MDPNLSSMLTAIMQELNALQERRASLVTEVQDIDTKLAGIAKLVGLQNEAVVPPNLNRLALPGVVDKRHVGSLPERMMQLLLEADRPHTRASLKALLKEDSKVGETVKRNENTFYNAVARYVRNNKVVEVDGFLYHPDRAPLPEGQEDPTGQHLPANVSPIRRLDLG